MILSAIAERLRHRSKDDFKGRHFEASLILAAKGGVMATDNAKSSSLRRSADRARCRAFLCADDHLCRQLLDLAHTYEKLADTVERSRLTRT
jgi:hypothetical protein